MNKSELVKALADQANISLDEATLVVNTFVDSMKDSLLEGGRVEIRGFGSFKVKEYGSYAGRNPRTGEKVAVEPKRLPFFRAGKELKEYLRGSPPPPAFLFCACCCSLLSGQRRPLSFSPRGKGCGQPLSFPFPPRRSRSCASCMPPIPTARFIPALPEDTRW